MNSLNRRLNRLEGGSGGCPCRNRAKIIHGKPGQDPPDPEICQYCGEPILIIQVHYVSAPVTEEAKKAHAQEKI